MESNQSPVTGGGSTQGPVSPSVISHRPLSGGSVALGPCIEWQGTRDRCGYGQVRVGGQRWQAHRWIWTLANGPIPEGLVVMHRCDNPPCVNPGHLAVGTQAENLADMTQKGRRTRHQAFKTHCPAGHPYDEANTAIRPSGDRVCRICRRKATRESARRRRARDREQRVGA